MLQADVLQADSVDGATLAAAGFNAKAAVRVHHPAAVYGNLPYASGHFAAYGYAAVSVSHQTVGDLYPFAGLESVLPHPRLSGLDGDAIVSRREMHAGDQRIRATFGVYTVGVGAVGRHVDG